MPEPRRELSPPMNSTRPPNHGGAAHSARADDSGPVQPVLIGIGSNIDPEQHVPFALQQLQRLLGNVRPSALYLTRPLRGRDQQPYVNGVVAANTRLNVVRLRRELGRIEHAAGRRRVAADAYAARTLDLDLLSYGALVDAELELPDPDLLERDFLLLPAAELCPDWVHPLARQTLAALARAFRKQHRASSILREFDGTISESRPGPNTALPVWTLAAGFGVTAGTPPAPDLAAAVGGALQAGLLRDLLLISAVSYAALLLAVFLRQHLYVYFPARELTATTTAIGCPDTDVVVDTGDSGLDNGFLTSGAVSGEKLTDALARLRN